MTMLVYVNGLRGPVPEKWPEPLLDMHNKERAYLVKHELDLKEAKLTLDELVAKYPPPKVQMDHESASFRIPPSVIRESS